MSDPLDSHARGLDTAVANRRHPLSSHGTRPTARPRSIAAVHILLTHRADVSIANRTGVTPLARTGDSAFPDFVKIVRLLQAEASSPDLETLSQKCAPELVPKIEVMSGGQNPWHT
jgi:hypothetical protein